VGSGHSPAFSTRRLQLRNTKARNNLAELSFLTSVLAVKLNRRRLVVVLETKIHVYELNNVHLLEAIDTVPNPRGLCALSSADAPAPAYLVFPRSADAGVVAVYDAASMKQLNQIEAHRGPLSCLALSQDGALLATASDKGTVIRVFSLPDGNKLHTLRRGTYAAAIHSLAFSLDGSLLAVASDHATVHIYRLQANAGGAADGNNAMAAYLGAVWEQGERDFATAKVPTTVPCVCGFTRDAKHLQVATEDGALFLFAVEAQGGECRLVRRHALNDGSPVRGVMYANGAPLPGSASPPPKS
jgi:autophagy-related protein 18